MIVKETAPTLEAFREAIQERVAALQRECSDFLAGQDRSGKLAPREIRIEIGSTLDVPEAHTRALTTAESSMECWDNTYVCGKTTSGYIYCTNKVCMIVGPITVEA